MSGASPALTATGPRVHVRPVEAVDEPAYRAAVLRSRDRLAQWNPVDADDLARHLAGQGPTHRTFMLWARKPAEGDAGLVGRVNVSNVVAGRFRSASLGYDAYDPYAGRGLFAEGLGLVVGVALRDQAEGGLGLHRVEANVQPGNVRSALVLRSLGFRPEGFVPRMLHLPGPDGQVAWRDHHRYAVTAEEWPAPPYAPATGPRSVVVVGEPRGPGRSLLARALAAELGAPLLPEEVGDAVWDVLAASSTSAVVEAWWGEDTDVVHEGLSGTGVEGSSVVFVPGDLPRDPRSVSRLALEVRAVTHGAHTGTQGPDAASRRTPA